MISRAVASPPASALLLTTLALGLGSCGGKPSPFKPGPTDVGVVTLKSETAPLTAELPGRTSPFAVSEVRPQVTGIVLDRLFVEGSNVKKGQPLYRIDPAPYRAAQAQAQAQLANAQANLRSVKLKAQRYADLVKIKAVSQQDYDDAEAAYGQAEASVQQAQASLQTAQINLGYTEIKAPISGRAGRSSITQGALATAGQTNALTTVQALDPIFVDLSQSTTELLRLEREIRQGRAQKDGALSAKVTLTLEDGSTYPLQGRLEFTDVTVDQGSGSVTLRAVFPNPDGQLLPGMYVRARIVEAVVKNAVLAPQQGVLRDAKGAASVMLVDAQGKAQSRQVQLGPAIGGSWLVTQGLAAGDVLIVEGQQKVQPGAAVHAVPAGSPPQGAGRP